MLKKIDEVQGTKNALSGLENEQLIVNKFNNWKENKETHIWLENMGYSIRNINSIIAKPISGYKTDISLEIFLKDGELPKIENIQLKLVKNKKGFSQIDKRWVKEYQKLWGFDDVIFSLLSYFSGSIKPYHKNTKYENRMLLNEFSEEEQDIMLKWFEHNKRTILNNILQGKDLYLASWVLVTHTFNTKTRYTIVSIEKIVNYCCAQKVQITKSGVLMMGLVSLQRKGGDAGRKTANKLQFKIDPLKLFRI